MTFARGASQVGIAYSSPRATLVAGDAIEALRTLPDASVDVVLSDPPFSSGTRKEGQKGVRKSMTTNEEWFDTDSLTSLGFVSLMRRVALEARRALKPGGHLFLFIDWRMAPHLAAAVESVDLRHVDILVWDKLRMGMGHLFRRQHEFILHFTHGVTTVTNRRDRGNVLPCPPIRNGYHPTQKPVALLRTILEVVTPPGGVVADPFAGAGSTLIAGLSIGAKVWGSERAPQFIDYSAKRIESFERDAALPKEESE